VLGHTSSAHIYTTSYVERAVVVWDAKYGGSDCKISDCGVAKPKKGKIYGRGINWNRRKGCLGWEMYN
jgi:hypothetical protein